jgi:hypothetical protein
MISSASSRALHWLIGRSELAGISQASAMIWQICSGVIRAGRPDLGASANRWARLCSVSGISPHAHQRARHWRTVLTSNRSRRATSLLLSPSPANSTTRARMANCCPVVRARTRRSSACRSSSLSATSGGFGPGIPATSYQEDASAWWIQVICGHLRAYICLTVLGGAIACCRRVSVPNVRQAARRRPASPTRCRATRFFYRSFNS